MRPSRARLVVWLAYATLALVWSTTWIGIKVGLHGAPPLIGAGLRFMLAGGTLAVWRAARREPLGVPRGRRRLVATIALTLFAVPYACVYLGETQITSGLAAVLYGTQPLFSALIADRMLAEEPLTSTKLVGIVVGVGGLAVVFNGGLALRATAPAVVAMVAVLLAPALNAFGQIKQKREGAALPATLMLAWAMGGAGVALLLLGLAIGPRRLTLDGRTLGAIAYLGIAGSVAGFALLFWLLRRIRAVSAALLYLLLPILALIEGWAAYGEPLNLSLALGSVVVAGGIGIASLDGLRAGRRRRRAAAARRLAADQAPIRRAPS